MHPFLIVALPRSRTAWLARFLTFDGRVCHHEPSLHWKSPDDLDAWCRGTEGASDTMMVWLAHEARRFNPSLPLVVVRRPRHEVIASIKRLDYAASPHLPWYYERQDRRLDRIEDELNPLSVTFDDLGRRETCAAIFRHCLGRELPTEWWERWKDTNVQADIPETLRLLKENSRGVDNVYGVGHASVL